MSFICIEPERQLAWEAPAAWAPARPTPDLRKPARAVPRRLVCANTPGLHAPRLQSALQWGSMADTSTSTATPETPGSWKRPPPRGGPGVPRKRWYWVISAPFHRQHPPVGHCGAAASTAGRPGALQIQNLRPDHDPWGVQARSSTTSAFVLWLCFVICVVIYHQGPRACCSSYGCCMSGEIPTHSTIYLTDEMNLLFGRSG
jgi:hypothetical protein